MGSRARLSIVPWLHPLSAVALLLALVALCLSANPGLAQARKTAVVLEIDGAIGPATADYVTRGLEAAAEDQAALVILRIDTPGGLDSSMRDIIRAILSSPVPVASFVSPGGARAASAGTYILYASHVAAMAPGTNLGAATPVQMGGGGLPFGGSDEAEGGGDAGDDAAPAQPRDASEAKAINDAVAYIRSLATLRDRNADWAEAAVREARSLSAGDAAREGVIDFLARDLQDLLLRADGRSVEIAGEPVVLDTRGLDITHAAPDWRTQLLSVITNPNVALIFMMIGIYGLIFEFMNPGALFPGTIGAICLLVGLFSLAVLPLNYAGIALILLGVGLMIAEAFAPSFGILGVGGAVAFILGATLLFDRDVPGMALSWPVIGGVAAASLALSLVVVRMAVTSHRREIVSGPEAMIGAVATVVEWRGHRGHVFVHGERWAARSSAELATGDEVRIISLNGLTLDVAPRPGDAP